MADLVMSLQEQLPQPVEHGEGQRCRPCLARGTLLGGLGEIGRGADLRQRHAVHRLQQRAEHRQRIDAIVVLALQRRQRRGRIAGEHLAEQFAHGAAIGQAEHLANRLRGHPTAFKIGMADRLV